MISLEMRSSFFILPLVVVVLLVLEFVATNEIAGFGRKIWELDRQIDLLHQENDLLGQRVASASSLASIESRARSMGFRRPDQFITIGEETFALNQPQ